MQPRSLSWKAALVLLIAAVPTERLEAAEQPAVAAVARLYPWPSDEDEDEYSGWNLSLTATDESHLVPVRI